jgi:uncharacterized protein YoxC
MSYFGKIIAAIAFSLAIITMSIVVTKLLTKQMRRDSNRIHMQDRVRVLELRLNKIEKKINRLVMNLGSK